MNLIGPVYHVVLGHLQAAGQVLHLTPITLAEEEVKGGQIVKPWLPDGHALHESLWAEQAW